MLFFYQKIFLPEFVCHHTDRAAMLNSLEVRAPFLGTKVIKFANNLPIDMKVKGETLKWILKEIPDNASSFYDSLLILFKGKTFFFGTSIGILAWLTTLISLMARRALGALGRSILRTL